jgi:hypothetical protein
MIAKVAVSAIDKANRKWYFSTIIAFRHYIENVHI